MIRQTWTDKEPSEEREELLHTNIIITNPIVIVIVTITDLIAIVIVIVIVNANVIVILNVLIIVTNTMHPCQIPGEILENF